MSQPLTRLRIMNENLRAPTRFDTSLGKFGSATHLHGATLNAIRELYLFGVYISFRSVRVDCLEIECEVI
jgi:hypothetical protein